MQDRHFTKNEAIPIQAVLYNQFIKYEQLNNLVRKEFNGCNVKIINIFIDIYSFLMPLYRCYNVTDLLNITSCIVNMAIHYRNYFKKLGVYPNIFLLYSPTMSVTNTKHIPQYNRKYTERMMNNIQIFNAVNQNLGLLGTIVPYLPDIFFKMGTVETSVMAYDIMTTLESRGIVFPNIFVSSSQYAFQIPATYPKCVLFYKKKDKNNADLSFSTNNLDCLEYFIKETKNQYDISTPKRSEWMTGYMMLTGIPKRDISSIFNYKVSLKILLDIEKSYNVINPKSIYNHIINNYPKTNITLEELEERYKCIDLNYQLEEYRLLPESKEESYLNQVKNFDELVHINDQYFKDNPMLLDKL